MSPLDLQHGVSGATLAPSEPAEAARKDSGMDKIRITGGQKLVGTIQVGGAKNAALPLMCAALLSEETLTLSNIPRLADITTLANLLLQHGVHLSMDGDTAGSGTMQTGRRLALTAKTITSTEAPYDLVRKMRASVLVLGPLVARCGEARVSLPGGCAIGTRPVDLHIKGLETLGAEIELDQGYVVARAPKGLIGADITFPFVSVGATENLMMAASLAKGTTRLINAAREPEIVDLAKCLIAMGARITGAGTDTIEIEGVASLHAAEHSVLADRIEAGSFLIAGAATSGNLLVEGADLETLGAAVEILRQTGAVIQAEATGLRVIGPERLTGVDMMTEPYPGYPTDLQAQFMAAMTRADGASMISETIFENRFMHVPELLRMGANINLHGGSAMVRGVERLKGAPVMATDLRASMSLVIAALMAEGETTIGRVYHLDRGYERLEGKLAACGALIERLRA